MTQATMPPDPLNATNPADGSSAAFTAERRLDQCLPGTRATISSVSDDGPVAQRLMELGLLEGSSIEIVRIAPLGDPMEIRVEEARLSIRKSEARHIHVVS